MIWLSIVVVALVAMAPLGVSVWRGGGLRSRREAALALHRAQLTELDRDLAEGRLLATEHEAARLEVQRRLLAEAEQTEAATRRSGAWPVIAVAVVVPALALGLYVADGTPNYAAESKIAEVAQQDAARANETARDMELITQLRAALGKLDPNSERTRKGYVMLGNAELSVGHLSEAADAFRHALATRFEPTLGAETAEVITETQGHVTPEAVALFKRALAEAPADVAWRKAAEKRLAEAGNAG